MHFLTFLFFIPPSALFLGGGNVISGMRNSADVVIEVDVVRAMTDGIPFYISANGVVLTPGNAEGAVPPEYFLRISRR